MTGEEEIWCDVSDDEMYNPGKEKKGTWEPKAEDILRLFDELKTKKVLELHWKCPGRRPPDSEDDKVEESSKEELLTTPVKLEEKKPVVPNEFDFDDDEPSGSKAVITPRRTPGSAPKSQKREARMDKILKDIMQQRKLQAAEREARKLAGAKSPRTSSPSRARIGSPAGSPRTPNRQSPVRVGAGMNESISNTPSRVPSEVPMPSRMVKSELTMQTANLKVDNIGHTTLQVSHTNNSSGNTQTVHQSVSIAMATNSPTVKDAIQSPNVAPRPQMNTSTNQTPDTGVGNKINSSNSDADKMDTS